MALPNPIPDNPTRWDGWKNYNSDNLYDRLCLSYGSNPNAEQIEENCRQLLVWWQKKLPLKNQPSNPISQLLRGGLDEAPAFLAEARTKLLDPVARAAVDVQLHAQIVAEALTEFKKLLSFVLADKKLSAEDEQRLYERGAGLGLSREEMDAEVQSIGAERVVAPPPAIEVPAPVTVAAPVAPVSVAVAPEEPDPFSEFRRMLRLSKLSLDGGEMTDDQRDAMCNMGESLGLTGGQAEDLIDEYLEAASGLPAAPVVAVKVAPHKPAAVVTAKPAVVVAKKPDVSAAATPRRVPVSPLAAAQERQKYANFTNSIAMEMLLVSSGQFQQGSAALEAAEHEQPVTPVTVSCFHLARHPVTNAQFEAFDPKHREKRAAWADEKHPVVYVNSREAEQFCQWLSQKEGKRYRLPTEAEWEYAARGSDNLVFPWGSVLDAGHFANFADKNTTFAWRDAVIDDGFAETAPVGSYPRGKSPFGIEDLAGNVFEWCADFFEAYKGKERMNPRGPAAGMKRIYRGGSWKSRPGSLRASARHFNLPDYSSNDVGFRVVCECVE
ncbi:MAG: formylglycine-generating enzyme family protein [Chthoniobacter sp.]|nr:formylglycine-generating enzyme family protein [Chthoniobacter sp.]